MTMDLNELVETSVSLEETLKEVRMAVQLVDGTDKRASLTEDQLRGIEGLLSLFWGILDEKMHETKVQF